jgi:hypothetical protein
MDDEDKMGVRSSVVIHIIIGVFPLDVMPCFMGFTHMVRYDWAYSRFRIISVFFLWCQRFEPWTLHILCIVLTNRAKLTGTK